MLALPFALATIATLTIAAARHLNSVSSSVDTQNLFKRLSSGCSASGSPSCHNTTVEADLCCFEAPGGLLVQTQFWDTDPVTGPANSWTIHGLWPDNCDGTFEENCDSSRDYTGITSLLTSQGASDTLAYMQEFWLSNSESDEAFWEAKLDLRSTHGTCYSTLRTSCLPSGSAKGAEAVAFFETVVKLFKTLPTYDWLEQEGIQPSSSKTYSLSQITSALKSASGVTPALDCDGSNISQIYWYFNLKGSVIDGVFEAIDAPKAGSCKSSGLKYPPKTDASTTTPSTGTATATRPSSSTTKPESTTSAPPSTGTLPAKAVVSAITSSGSTIGNLLSFGTWSTQTGGTYTLSGSTSGFKMTSSKGPCGVSSGTFSCSSNTSGSSFSAVSSGAHLLVAYEGSTSFSSDAVPSGTAQETVYTGAGHSQQYTLALVST